MMPIHPSHQALNHPHTQISMIQGVLIVTAKPAILETEILEIAILMEEILTEVVTIEETILEVVIGDGIHRFEMGKDRR